MAKSFGPFELERRLGVGGMGIVYLATYSKTGQKVAVKVLTPALSTNEQLLARFERETEILKKLRHPHIVQFLGAGKHGAQRYYVMELMEGGSLEEIISQKGRLSWEQTIDCSMQIAKALEHAHYHGIVHRDLKPANVFLTGDGTYKLGDFGIARDTQRTALTAAGKTVGTYAYMAPEQISGKPPVSRKTDLYALGCVMFEMLTGRPPFDAETAPQMFMQHLQEQPPRVTSAAIDCPIWLESIIVKLLEKDPEDRYFDALAVQVALDEVGQHMADQASVSKATLAGGPTAGMSKHDESTLKKILGRKKKKKRKAVPFYERVWFLTACLVLLVAGVAWGFWPLSDQEKFERAQALMASDDPVGWDTARKKYLDPILENPESQYAAKAQAYVDQIEMSNAERRALARARRGRDPESEAERHFMRAHKFEEFGDRRTALATYRGMVDLFAEDKESRPFVNLARRRVEEINSSPPEEGDAAKFVNDQLRRADQTYDAGQTVEADRIWSSIVTLYENNRELEPQVRYARARMKGEKVEPFDYEGPTVAGESRAAANGDSHSAPEEADAEHPEQPPERDQQSTEPSPGKADSPSEE